MSDTEARSPQTPEDETDQEDKNIRLIRLVKQKAFLYDKDDRRYCDRAHREKTWAKIAAEVGLSQEEAKDRWTRLRNNYSKVLSRRRHRFPRVSAACAPNSSWVYDSEMEFVKEHLTQSRISKVYTSKHKTYSLSPSPSSSGVQKWESQAEEAEAVDDDEGSYQEPWVVVQGNSKRNSSMEAGGTPDDLHQVMLSYLQSASLPTEEPLVLWFKSLLPTLKQFRPEHILNFQIFVMQEIQRMATQERL